MMIAIVTMLSVTLSLLLTINAASLYSHQLQASHELAKDYRLDHHEQLPRKLIVNNKVEGHKAKHLVSSNGKNKAASSGELHKREEEAKMMIHAAKGTRQEYIEGSGPIHEFFTMDYSNVRRRRPIHNKSFPKTVTNSP